MKKAAVIGGIVAIAGAMLFSGGCEWSGGGGAGSFNTSQGAGINVNFSGVYRGNYPGGKAVETSSGAAITRLTLTQSGDSIEVIDNNGNKYSGKVGSPGTVFTPTESNPTIPTGAQLMQAQVNFSGTDGSSGREVNFVGIVHVVSITDIKSSTQSSSSSSSSSSSQPTTTTQTINDGTNTTITTTIVTPVSTIVTVETHNNQTGQTISKTTTETKNETSSNSQTVTYSITEANSQYRLEGQWLEKGGNTSGVDALSPAASGVVSRPIN